MTEQQIATTIRENHGYEVVDLTPLSGGNDAYAKTFQAIMESGEAFFLKLRPSVDSGVVLSAELHLLGIENILATIPTKQGKIAAPVQDKFLLVYRFIDGTNGFEKSLELDHWRQVGTALRKIHEADLAAKTLSQLRIEEFQVEGVSEFLSIRERLMDAPQTIAEEAMGRIAKSNADYIERVLTGYEEQSKKCRKQEWQLVPCHADLHIGNILVDSQGSVHLIDWDGPRLAPRECDLLFFCDGGIMKRHGMAEEVAFFEGYGAYQPDPTALSYYKFARDLEDFVAYCREATEPNFTSEQHMEAVQGFQALFPNQADV